MALGTFSVDEIDDIIKQAQPTPGSVPGVPFQMSASEIDSILTPPAKSQPTPSKRRNRIKMPDSPEEFGRQSLELAKAGKIKSNPSENAVNWDRIPTLEEPTQEYSRGGYSPNEQRDMVRALMGQAEANERRNAQNISSILDTANREGLLSEQDQKQVDKLNRRINALQNVSTGDVAIDDIAAQNNQQKIAELQNQVDRIYQLSRSSDDQNIDRMLEPGYKASKAERKYANDLFDAYLEQNPKAKELYNTNDAAMSSALALRMSPEEMQEYARMVSLKDKMSPGYAFGQGLTQSMPFIRQLENKSDDIASQLWGYDQDKYGVEAQRQNASTQNKGAELAGNALYQLGQYAAFAPAIESIPGVQNVSQGVGKALSFGNEALAKGIGNVVSGQASDMLLDTLPNAVIPAVMEGRWGDVLPDALKNQGENLAFNALGEFGGAALNLLRGGNIPKLDAPASQADEVADALRQTEELNPVDLARQNASGVDEIAQSQRQAAENLDELSRRVPPTEDDGFRLESDPYDDFDFDDELDDFAEEVSEKVHWNDDGTATITRQDGSRYMEYPDGHTEELPRLEEAPEQAVRQEIPSFDNPTPGSKNSKLGTNTMMKVDPERAAKELSGGLYEYVPVTEQETMREAARAVSDNPDAAYNDVLNLDTKSYTAADVDKSMMLRAHLQDQLAEAKAAGDASRQLILSSRLNELTLQQRRMATNGGQVTQAWAKWSRNNADGALFTGESMAARNYDKAVKGDKNLENNVHEVVTDIRNNLEKLNGNKSMPDADGLGKSGSRTMAEDEGLGSGNPYWDELVNKAKSGELDDVSEEDLSANIQDMIRGILDDKANAKVKRNLEDKNIKKISDTLAAEIKQNEDIEATLDMLDMAGVTGFTGFDDSVEQEIREIFKEAEQYGFNSRQRVDLENQAYAKIANALNYSGSWHDKIDSLRYFAMLANPKTHIRNTVGNMTFRQLTNFKDNLAGALEGIVDRASKAAGKGGIERTTTFINKVGADKPLYDASYKNADSVARLLEGGDKYTSARQGIEGQKATWGYSKAGQAVNKIQGANTNLLELEDTLALRRKYADSLTRYLKANGADESIFQATDDASIELLQKAQAHAIDEAKKATFHQDNAVAESMSKFVKDAREIDLSDSVGAKKKAGNLGKKVLGFITNALLPFKKTPLNILTSVAEYSPVNLAAVGMDAYKLAKGTGTAAELIDDIAKTMTGTGILALGYAGAKEGLITGAYDPDRGQQDQLEGKQEYALKIGDKSYTLNWNSPSLTMLLSGANLADASDLSVSEMLSLIAKAGDPVLEETMLSSLADALSSAKYAEDSGEVLAQFGTTTAKNYVSQFIPTELGNISRSIDNTRRSTYTEKTGAAGTVDRTIKNIQNKIPGLSQNNEPYLNAWGEEQQNLKGDNNLLERLAYNHLSPGYYSEEDISDTDAYLDSLYEQTGDTTLFPKVASNTLDGERLTPEAYTARSRAQGQAAKDLIDTMRQDPEMMQLSPKTQADIVAKIYAESKEIGKNAVNGESGYDADSIIDDLKREYTFKEKGLVGSTGSAYSSQSAIDAWESRDLDRYQEYRNFLNESGKSDSIDNWNKYKEGGAQAFQTKTETKKPAQTAVPTVDTGDINWSSYGITNSYANEAYAKAKGEIPSLTPQVYANTFKSIDTSGNSKVTQDEVIAYLNNIGASDSQGQQIWAAYGSNNWKKIPVLGDNGWKKK